MKLFAVLLCLCSVAYASKIDWANLTPREVYPREFKNLASDLDSRIAGGKEASTGQFPFQAALTVHYGYVQYFCNGFLIKDDIVVTSAICVFGGATKVTVRLGVHDLRQTHPDEQEFTALGSSIEIHPGFELNYMTNDIALIRLPQKAKLGATVQTIALPTDSNQLYESQTCRVSGWGRTSDESYGSDVLNFVDLPVISNDDCRQFYTSHIFASSLCASGAGGKSTCVDDRGSPLVCDSPNGKIVIGLASLGSSSGCTKGYPAIFTRITHYLDWIKINAVL